MSLSSPSADDAPGPQRRRGAALESALLEAAWEELIAVGYEALTMEAVAERARTSRAVLYRRWPTKSELVLAAVAHAGASEAFETPDTGTLRGDVIEILRWTNRSRVRLGIRLVVRLGGFLSETGTSFAQLRDVFLGGRPSKMDQVLRRAVERGEVDAARLTPRLRTLPFDLFRHELLMTFRPVPDETIEEIVDQVFLPLVTR